MLRYGWIGGGPVSKNKILIVDDDQDIREMIGIYLESEGYDILFGENGRDALSLICDEIDLIILDVMMPGVDGIQACREIRKKYHMPIIFLTAKNEDHDKIKGLSCGADDYITKPFNPLELIARVKSQLRRYLQFRQKTSAVQPIIEIEELQINLFTHQVLVAGDEKKLTPTEFDILVLLANHPGVVFSTDKIYENVWKDPCLDASNTVMVHIRKLREKIELNPKEPQYIKTVWGVGYKIEK